jgi:predicted XRE-type DNA-binding protein
MKADKLEVGRGSGNVFRDLGREHADLEQLRALLAVEVMKALDLADLTLQATRARTSLAAAILSNIRKADLSRFTADRLVSILNRLGFLIDVESRVRRPERAPIGTGALRKLDRFFRPHYVTWSDQQKIEFAAPEYQRNVMRIATETGLRIYKELTPMKKDQLDLVNRRGFQNRRRPTESPRFR